MGNKVLCVIPCRKGSKRLPDKTMRLFKNNPLIFKTLNQAEGLFNDNQIIINTDYSFDTYDFARYVYKRPEHLCGDNVPTIDVLKEMMPKYPECEMVVLLQVTSPNRSIETIKECIKQAYILKKNVRSERGNIPDGQCYVWWVNKEWGDWLSIQSKSYSPDINTQLDFEIAEVLY